jgi:hypothetical protein
MRELGWGAQTAMAGDPAVAKRAALALAWVVPWFGLPIGWAFMMFEDRRRQAIGRYCAIWSAVAMVVHTFVLFAILSMMSAVAASMTSNLNAEKILKERIDSMSGSPGQRPAPENPEQPAGP